MYNHFVSGIDLASGLANSAASSEVSSDDKLKVSFFGRVFSQYAECENLKFEEFCKDHLSCCPKTNNKKSLPLFSFASFKGNRRLQANVEYVSAAVLDFDYADTDYHPSLHKMELMGYQWAYYSSYNSKAESPRYRVIIPFTKPVPTHQYINVMHGVMDMLGNPPGVDTVCFNPDRAWFLPGMPSPENYDHDYFAGEKRLNPDDLLYLYGTNSGEDSRLVSPAPAKKKNKDSSVDFKVREIRNHLKDLITKEIDQVASESSAVSIRLLSDRVIDISTFQVSEKRKAGSELRYDNHFRFPVLFAGQKNEKVNAYSLIIEVLSENDSLQRFVEL